MLISNWNSQPKRPAEQQELYRIWQSLPERDKNAYAYSFEKFRKHMEKKNGCKKTN